MSKEYIITCESTADLAAASKKEAGIPVLQQYFRIGEEHLEDTACSSAVSFADGIDQTKEQGCYGQRSKNA